MATINFGVSTYEMRAPGIRPQAWIIDVPDSGGLPKRRESPYSPFQPHEVVSIVPKLINLHGFPTVALEEPPRQAFWSNDLWLMWIEPRGEWVAIYHSNWLEDICSGTDDSYQGPYELTDYEAAKLLEAYGIPATTLPTDLAVRTSPDELVRLREQQLR